MVDFVLDFSKFIDGDNIDYEDLVVWVIIGMMYVMYFEDVFNIVILGNFVSFYLRFFSYFDEDLFMSFYDGVVIKFIEKGVDIDILGFLKIVLICVFKNKFFEFFGCYGNY